jgi:hypothetical protein
MQLVTKYPRLLSITDSKIASIIELFQEHSISKEEIFTYPEVFSYSIKTLIERFKLLEDGYSSGEVKLVAIKDAEQFFRKRLQKTLSEWDLLKHYGSKAGMVMSKLRCTQSEAEDVAGSIQAITLSKLESKLDCILNEISLPPKLVLNTPWVLSHSSKVLHQRSVRLKDTGLTYENCGSFLHLLTVESRLFEKRLAQCIKECEVLGECCNSSEYLCVRLGCGPEDVGIMSKNFQKLLSVSATKVKDHLDFLLIELQFPARDVIKYPRVLSFATETIQTRYKLLLEKGIHPDWIGVKELQLKKPQFHRLLES